MRTDNKENPMHPPPPTISWTRHRTHILQAGTVGLVFLVGWLAGGAAQAISLGSGVAVAVFGAERITWARPRKPQPPDATKTVPAEGSDTRHE